MSTRNLDALFAPKAIALVGASNETGSIGAVLAQNLYGGGFQGPILPVNPHARAVRSALNYHSVAELPITPDLAVIATPAPTVPKLVAELGGRGCRAAVVITAGFGGEGSAVPRRAVLEAARPHLMRIVGPNCLGFLSPPAGINASFTHLTPARGDVALLTQSGAVAAALLDWAAGNGLGFSHVVSLGDMSDVDFGDLLDWLSVDAATKSILLYVETVTSARKFMSAARIAARAKPVVVVKGGRSAAGAKAALSHTGALAGADAVYDAAFRRAGMLRVDDLAELFEAAATLRSGAMPAGERLAILTNGGGLGVLATDALEGHGSLAVISEATRAALAPHLPQAASLGNPVDILGDSGPDRYTAALEVLLAAPEADAVLVINCPTAIDDGSGAAAAIAARAAAGLAKPVLAAWTGEKVAAATRRTLLGAGLPTYASAEAASRAFGHLVRHRANRRLLDEAPPAAEPVGDAARAGAAAVLAAAQAEGRALLSAPEAKTLLHHYGIAVVMAETAATPDEAGRIAARMACPVALKILSKDITHKSDVGGVALSLSGAAAVEEAARAMLARVGAAAPQARLNGFSVEPMVTRRHGRELIAGIADDATFGPVILFGAGGVTAELVADRAVELPPLNAALAGAMMGRTRIAKLLGAWRDIPAADTASVEQVLVRLSQLAIDFPQIAELDINPLVADESGAIAVDARVVLRQRVGAQLAICPYPRALEAEAVLPDGTPLTIRPVRPEDGPALAALVAAVDPEDVALPFLAAVRTAAAEGPARIAQIDYDREMTLVAVPGGTNAIAGFARLVADPENIAAEFAVLVREDLRERGIGNVLLQSLVAHARSRGLTRLAGDAPASNATILKLAGDAGFVAGQASDGTVRLVLDLR